MVLRAHPTVALQSQRSAYLPNSAFHILYQIVALVHTSQDVSSLLSAYSSLLLTYLDSIESTCNCDFLLQIIQDSHCNDLFLTIVVVGSCWRCCCRSHLCLLSIGLRICTQITNLWRENLYCTLLDTLEANRIDFAHESLVLVSNSLS